MSNPVVTENRRQLMLTAAFELDKLARTLPDLVPLDEDQTHYVIKGACGRFLRLTSVLMSGLGDNCVPDDDLERIVDYGATGQG